MHISSREFNQNASPIKKVASDEVVCITDRGKPSHVLMSFDEYRRLTGPASIVDALALPDEFVDIDFDPPRSMEVATPADIGHG